ncbi:MAG: hypothetical protein JWM11_6942 [Planctomycetaceae bacterium]|nr:hypothetical protein [Planctomycetaceae bacterium]
MTIDRNRIVFSVLGIALIAGLALFISSWRLPAQIGSDEAVFETIDALFTAVNSRDKRQLGECERRLRAYRESGKLPAAAAKQVESIIEQARSGQWEPAARRLYDFMLGQRRASLARHSVSHELS